jgi:hypothetical protein
MQHTYITTVKGFRFYEHGQYGDEFPLIVKVHGQWHNTHDYDAPNADDVDAASWSWTPLND